VQKNFVFVLSLFGVITGLFLASSAGCKRGLKSEDYPWVTMDENYRPQNFIEEFIKADSEQKGIFPVYIRNYDKNASILRRFRGANFAKANEAALKMAFEGLEDWMLIDLKYKNERGQEILRTILYVKARGDWKVGDSGSLLK